MNKFEINKSKCAGCGACLRACPHGAIRMEEDGKAFIDQNKCKKCGKCQEICPFDAIKKISEELDEKNAPAPIPYGPPPAGGKDLGTGGGRGMGVGKGRGLGRGPRDGRGGGRGGGGRRN